MLARFLAKTPQAKHLASDNSSAPTTVSHQKMVTFRPFFKRGSVFFMLSVCMVCVIRISAQEPSLAELIFQTYQELLLREDVQEILPTVLIELKKPEHQPFLTPATIDAVLDNPDLLKILIPDVNDTFITLLKEDAELRNLLSDPNVQILLQDPEAIDELANLLAIERPVLAPVIFERYQHLYQREEIREVLPNILTALKLPDTQPLFQPATIKLVAEDPDHLKILIPGVEDRFIVLLKEDTDIRVFINDPDIYTLLQNPIEIDELTRLLNTLPKASTVSITPASITSPDIGERFTIAVDLADAQNIAGYQVALQFDSEALRYISWEHGTYLSGEMFPIPAAIGIGELSFAATADTASDAAEGTLLTITFEVVAIKASMLSLTKVIFASREGKTLSVVTQNSEIVASVTPVWDVNKDGIINILDLTLVAAHFGEVGPTAADVNRDNVVNILDLTLVASHFGE